MQCAGHGRKHVLHGVQRIVAVAKLCASFRQHRGAARSPALACPFAVVANERDTGSRSGWPEDQPAGLAEVQPDSLDRHFTGDRLST